MRGDHQNNTACHSFLNFTNRLPLLVDRPASSYGNIAPPHVERGTFAGEFCARAAREFDPVSKMVAGDRNHQGNAGIARAFDQVSEALAVALPLAEAVDDDDVGTRLQGV